MVSRLLRVRRYADVKFIITLLQLFVTNVSKCDQMLSAAHVWKMYFNYTHTYNAFFFWLQIYKLHQMKCMMTTVSLDKLK